MPAAATGTRRTPISAPIDPNFGGCGRTLTDADGYYYFRTIKPGALSLAQLASTTGARRTSTSRSSAPPSSQRLITQLYFEGDPLIPHLPDRRTRFRTKRAIEQLIAPLDLERRRSPRTAIAYKFDIVLRGRRSTLFENRLEGN